MQRTSDVAEKVRIFEEYSRTETDHQFAAYAMNWLEMIKTRYGADATRTRRAADSEQDP